MGFPKGLRIHFAVSFWLLCMNAQSYSLSYRTFVYVHDTESESSARHQQVFILSAVKLYCLPKAHDHGVSKKWTKALRAWSLYPSNAEYT